MVQSIRVAALCRTSFI